MSYSDVIEKRNKLAEVHGKISIYVNGNVTPEAKSKINDLQDRLEFRIMEYEKQLLDEKIKIYEQVLKELKQCSVKSSPNKN